MVKINYSLLATDKDIEKTKKSLSKNGFSVTVANTQKDAIRKAVALIPQGAEVMVAASATLEQLSRYRRSQAAVE